MPRSRVSRLAPMVLALSALAAHAGGPRFITGSQYNYNPAPPGAIMYFFTPHPLYFTDPGNLNANVSHAQADAMVAAAAGVWNVPGTSVLQLAQGGTLAEHVSSANTYFNGTQVVFPADVQAANFQNIQIAVIYDTDGSVTDTLLGEDASDPSGCRQTGVTESVDSFGPGAATINHAVIVLNGRCVGSTPQQLTQMQYQLTRIFGRVLGLAWSQLNDNVFTGSPTPTQAQMQHWPLMHPIDVLCGPYTYQCMQSPFTLRPDDLSALALVYPIALPSNSYINLSNATYVKGWLYFATGQGMELVNMTVTRAPSGLGTIEDFEDVSAISGYSYQQNGGNPVTGPEPAADDVGRLYPDNEASFLMGNVPVTPPWTGLLLQAETINPLYTGEFALAPYQRPPLTLSGEPVSQWNPFATAGNIAGFWLYASDGATNCGNGADGTESAPAAADPSGWWTGVLCPTGHTSWWSASIKANRTWTLETTALDENGVPTLDKAQPVLGLWNTADATGQLPTVAAQGGAMNAMAAGVTQIQMPAAAVDSSYRIVVADEFGAGRPDFPYQARILYAASVTPAVLGVGGGQITITGTGFRQGNNVLVNGVPATVLSWSATQIVADAPSLAASGAGSSAVDVEVLDAHTGGLTDIPAALSYNPGAQDTMQLVSAPAALSTGLVAATPFAVRVFAADGLAPIAGDAVVFAVTSGAATLGCGSGPSCTVLTDATGLAQITLAGLTAGPVTLTASERSGSASVQITLNDTDVVRSLSVSPTSAYLAAGAAAPWSLTWSAAQNGTPAAGIPLAWTAAPGLLLNPGQGSTNSSGNTSITVQVPAIASGAAETVTGCGAQSPWSTVCATWTVYGVDPSQWMLTAAGGTGQSVPVGSALQPVSLSLTDAAGHPLQGATVAVHQTVYAWEGACPAEGPCPAAPVLATAVTSAVSDAAGHVQVLPLQVSGVPQVLQITATSGTQGFVSLALTVTP